MAVLRAASLHFRDNLQRVEVLVAANLNLKNTLRIAVCTLHGIVLKVVDLAEGLCGVANYLREAIIRREILGPIDEREEVLSMGDPENRPVFFQSWRRFWIRALQHWTECAASLKMSAINL